MDNRGTLPLWCKEVKKAMIDKDLTAKDIAQKTGKSYRWVIGVINGKVYSQNIVKEISDILGITDSGNFL